MPAQSHSLSYRIWNQTRLAMHVDSWVQICDEFERRGDTQTWSPYAAGTLVSVVHGLRQTVIVHLDMIKSRQGVSLYGLIDEAGDTREIDESTRTAMKREIDLHSKVLNNISRQRNNLVAHRSPSLTFQQVTEKYPVTLADLTAVSRTYYAVARELHGKVPYSRAWELVDQRLGAKTILRGLINSRESK